MRFVARRALAPSLVALAGALGLSLFPRASKGHETMEAPAASSSAQDHDHDAPAASDVTLTVTSEKSYSAASSDEVRNRDLMLRPRVRPGDILEVVPGLFAVQHAGGGKANQYFIRGFDADHGTDIALFVDGVPINMPSHGHGQGYADLHFIIPELVSTLSAVKGPYSAKYGDFATAAAVDLRYYDHLHESSVTFQAGRFGIFRGLFMVSPELGDDWSTIVAGEAYQDDGPFSNPEKLRRFNVFGRAVRHMGPGTLSFTAMSYTSGWNASGQVPLRALGTPELPTEFGTLDPSEGGSTQRHQFSVAYSYLHDDDEARALVYAIKYKFTLFSNFTFYANDPVNGDEIEQDDDRTVLGTSWSFKRTKKLGPLVLASSFGLQARSDSIENGLHHTVDRKIIGDIVDAGVTETSVGLYTEQDLRIAKWMRVVGGLRLDRFDVAVRDHLESQDPASPSTSGVAGATIASPKMSMIFTPADALDLYLNYGSGYHSNDARGAVRRNDPLNPTVTLLTRATSYEVGARTKLFERVDLAAALFRIDLESETVWDGDRGTTEAVGPTRRTGLELEGRAKLFSWLFLDADATFTHAAFRENAGNGNAVALAPTRTFSAGVAVKHPLGFFGALRVRAIAKRPANEGADRAAKPLDAAGWTIFDAQAGYRWKSYEAAIDVVNLFNGEWKEVQFADTSRTKGEVAHGVPAQQDIHFTPGWPFTIMARVTAYF